MRFDILAAAILILLGIVVFSVYSVPNNNRSSDDNDIIQKIKVDNNSFFEVSEDWDGFEAVTINTDELRKAADEGNVTIEVMEEDFNIEIQKKSRLKGENGYFYTGYITGSKEGKSDLYIGRENLSGSIEPGEPWNVTYNIAPTDKIHDGKVVHVVFMIDWEKERERLEKEGIDPLRFFLINSDSRNHLISIEVFDFNNKSAFKGNYSINPGDTISSPKINAELGQYRYEIFLDNKFTFEQRVQADYAAEVSSSETICIYVTDDPETPVTFGIEVS